MASVQEILEKIWNDPDFKKRVLANPRPVLADLGMTVPDGSEVRVWENTAGEMNFVLPNRNDAPAGFEPESVDPVAGRVVRKAWNDEGFRRRLLRDPRGAIAEATGVELPESLELRIHEDTDTLKNVVLPVNPDDEELTDADLETLAGGGTYKDSCQFDTSDPRNPHWVTGSSSTGAQGGGGGGTQVVGGGGSGGGSWYKHQ